jgi:2-keto-3-deoxy-L-rhamnonate aldolase RhmA
MANSFKEKLNRDEVVVVVNPDHPSSSLTEFIAQLGFDGIFIDCEHGMATIERVQDMCRAARVVGAQSIVRPESDAPYLLTRYLDAGAGGVMVPHIDTVAAAQQVVQTVRYARPKDYHDKMVIVMIESLTAISNLAQILSVDGIDVFFIGPNDLSHSMGLQGQMHHAEVKKVTKEAISQIREAGKVAGTLVVRETASDFVAAGCRYLYEHVNNLIIAGATDFKHYLSDSLPLTTRA